MAEYWRDRIVDIEIEHEPRQIEELYGVALTRLTPVGLVVLWPQPGFDNAKPLDVGMIRRRGTSRRAPTNDDDIAANT